MFAASVPLSACGHRVQPIRFGRPDRRPRPQLDTTDWKRVSLNHGALQMRVPGGFVPYEESGSMLIRYAIGGEAWRWEVRETDYVHASPRNTHLPTEVRTPAEACRLDIPGSVAVYTIEDGPNNRLIMGWFRRRGEDTWLLMNGSSPRAADIELFQ